MWHPGPGKEPRLQSRFRSTHKEGAMATIDVLLAEDHTIVRKGLRSLLDGAMDIRVVGEADNGREAVKKTGQLRPDVVVMDIAMPILNGLEATRQITRQFPDVKVVILTMHRDEEYLSQVLRAGAAGYVVKEAAPEELVSAIRAICQGESFLSPSIPQETVEECMRQAEATDRSDRYDRLTTREREVLQMVAEGRSNREMAVLLDISVKTIETHRANLMDKLGIHNTAELTQYAIRKKVISPN
jgi:two-component system, NarL family, response regulator NreC